MIEKEPLTTSKPLCILSSVLVFIRLYSGNIPVCHLICKLKSNKVFCLILLCFFLEILEIIV